jgi:hypothetical protein
MGVWIFNHMYNIMYIRTSEIDMKKSDKKEKKRESSVTNQVFPKYLFREGERWTHVDKFGNLWYEDIKTK